MLKMTVLAAFGGALGAATRYLFGIAATRAFGLTFPWGTLIVNVAGSLAIGLLIGWLANRASESAAAVRVFFAVGVLGGFTTFSAFALDVVTLLERKQAASAFGYTLASVILSVSAVFIGLAIMRQGVPR
ncbi:MAG: fluoride efflux transporter CrcB [Pseudomonadota bacterium]